MLLIIAQYYFTDIFAGFNDAMPDGFTSTDDLPLYVLDRSFDSFSDEFVGC